ncbi:MAG: hypothetical protein J6Y08_05025 [Clostridiales bacterium]|nr:hypothetical protein [Clostridiales bacterium]
MKTVKKLVATVLVLTMALSLAACGEPKKISGVQFKQILEKNEYMCEQDNDETGTEVSYVAMDSDFDVVVMYDLYRSKSDAKEFYDAAYDTFKDAKDAGEFTGSFTKTTGKFSAKGTFKNNSKFDGDMYMVIIKSDAMVIVVMTQDIGEDTVKKADTILKELGY